MWYVEFFGGRCGLRTGRKADIIREEGEANISSITKATKKQIAWVKAMQGAPSHAGRKK